MNYKNNKFKKIFLQLNPLTHEYKLLVIISDTPSVISVMLKCYMLCNNNDCTFSSGKLNGDRLSTCFASSTETRPLLSASNSLNFCVSCSFLQEKIAYSYAKKAIILKTSEYKKHTRKLIKILTQWRNSRFGVIIQIIAIFCLLKSIGMVTAILKATFSLNWKPFICPLSSNSRNSKNYFLWRPTIV